MNFLKEIHSPLVVLLHDRGDQVIPVFELRCFYAAISENTEVHYTEMQFQHLDPVKGKLPLFLLAREFAKFFLAVLPIFQQKEV